MHISISTLFLRLCFGTVPTRTVLDFVNVPDSGYSRNSSYALKLDINIFKTIATIINLKLVTEKNGPKHGKSLKLITSIVM